MGRVDNHPPLSKLALGNGHSGGVSNRGWGGEVANDKDSGQTGGGRVT